MKLIENMADPSAIDRPYRYTPLHVACKEGHIQAVSTLIWMGACVNAETEDKCTPLHLALQSGHEDIAKILIREGANVWVENDDRKTALDLCRDSQQQAALLQLFNRLWMANPLLKACFSQVSMR